MQVMEMVDNPEVLAAQVNALLSDPTVVDEVSRGSMLCCILHLCKY